MPSPQRKRTEAGAMSLDEARKLAARLLADEPDSAKPSAATSSISMRLVTGPLPSY